MCDFRTTGGPVMPERLSDQPSPLQFPCDVCGDERPAYLIQITRHDVSHQVGLEAGLVARTVRHCCDRRTCIDAAEDPEVWRIAPDGFDPWSAFDQQQYALAEACEEVDPDGVVEIVDWVDPPAPPCPAA